MTHTVESIQDWVDSYNFTTNANASKDILEYVVRKLPEHSYEFGPGETGYYQITISGPDINKTFSIKTNQ